MAGIEKQHFRRNRLPRLRALIEAAALVLLLAAPAASGAAAPEGELVRVWRSGFNEDLDADSQPDHWARTVDADHPHYVDAELDFTVARADGGSLKLCAGGAPVEYQSPFVEIEPQAAYDVSGFLKTEDLPAAGMRAARAFIEVRLYDRKRIRIKSIRGFPQATGTTDWTSVSVVDVARGTPGASFLRVATVLEGRSLNGAAWFDDILIKKRPVAFLSTNHAANIFYYSDSKILFFESRGLPTAAYDVAVTILGETGEVVHSVALEAETDSVGTLSVTYPLPLLPVGPYEVTVQVSNRQISGLSHKVRMGVLPDYKRRRPGKNFGLSLSEFPDDIERAVQLAAASGAGWIKLPLGGHPERKAEQLGTVAELRRLEIMPVGVLCLPAEAGSESADASEGTDSSDWVALFGETTSAFAGRVECWQMGGDGSSHVIDSARGFSAFAALKKFIDGVSFTSLCGVALERSGMGLAGGAEVGFVSLEAWLFKDLAGAETEQDAASRETFWVWLDFSDWNVSNPKEASARLVAEMASLFSLGAKVIFFKDPWQRQGVVDGQGNISPFGLAVINLLHQLAGYSYSGVIALPDNTPNAIFTRGDETAVLLWPRAGGSRERIFLGEAIEIVDIYGRRSQAKMEGGENVLSISEAPVLLSGVNPAVVRTRQTFQVEPKTVDSIYQLQPVFLSFRNEFGTPIVGELSVGFPKYWEARPDKFFVRLKPGQTFRKSTNLLVPYNALSGPQEINLTLDLGGSGTQKTTLIRRVELGSTAFTMEVEIRGAGADLAIYQKVSNISQDLIDVTAFLEGAELERTEQPPRVMAAGSSTTFLYKLPDADSWTGRTLRATVRDRYTDRFLNHEFIVPADAGLR